MSLTAVRMSRMILRFGLLIQRASAVSSAHQDQSMMGNYLFGSKAYTSDASGQSGSHCQPPADNEFRRLSDAEWRQRLTPEQYQVCRQKGTERPFTGEYVDNKQKGTYTCVACGAPLFESKTKFDSGSGWPSFYQPHEDTGGSQPVATQTDRTLGMVRTEALCAQCDSHLGHVFSDGPAPTGMRYCINSASLNFVPEKKGNM